MKLGIGQPVARVEDHRLLCGRGRFTDDINLPDQLHGCVVRSPHPHARIAGIDIAPALAAPGVAAVFTGADVEADGLGTLPSLARGAAALTRPDGSPIFEPGRLALQPRKVSFVGDCVAFVVADTAARARDAADLLDVEYEPLPVVTSAEEALAEGAPAVWEDCSDNICYRIRLGDAEAVETAIAGAAHVTRARLPISRVCMNPMEPRSALGSHDASDGRYTLHTGLQNVHAMREWIARDVLGVPESRLRVVSPDMGGSFGLRASVFPEMALVLWASRKLGRPVKWTGDRSEAHLVDDHGRDQVMEIELALDRDGRFVGLRVGVVAAMGAYLSYFGPFPPFINLGGLAGVYRTPAICADVHAVFTNTAPTAPYRGAGRPEAALAIEHVIDRAARELGIDRVELRRRNLIPPEAMPFQTGLSFRYDCGEFERNMDEALAAIDVAGFPSRRATSEAAGRRRGLGIANTIEPSAGVTDEWANIVLDPGGSATISVGAHSHGQGHETVFRQLVTERLGLDFERIRYVQGDTDQVPYGWGTGGSRVAVLGGSALVRAMDRVVERGRRLAAHSLECAAGDVEFAQGRFRISGTDRSIGLQEVLRIAFTPALRPPGEEGGLSASASFAPSGPTFPTGCHACEVEIDPETGVVEMQRYCVVEDVGTVLNPMLLRGQLQGGIVQGFGQIVLERFVVDEDGQPLTGSFMDYAMPRADEAPFAEIGLRPVPTALNPLGAKGAGEAGTVGAMPCVMSAIEDALASIGVDGFEMPATPERIWRAIRNARN